MVDADALPQTIDVVRTRAGAMGLEVVVQDLWDDELPERVSGVLVQYPGASGAVRDPRPVVAAAKERGGLVVVAADLLALTLLESPGELGADVAVGSTQRFGVPLFYGGPHAAFMAVRKGLERHLPGRLVGVSVDAEGRPAYRLALQTREQHIRRTRRPPTSAPPSAARRRRRHVRRAPRPRRPARDRDPRRRGRRPPRRVAARGWRRGGPRRVLRHRARPRARRADEVLSAARDLGCTCVASTPTTSASSWGDRDRGDPRAVLKAFGVTAGEAGRGRALAGWPTTWPAPRRT